MTIDQSCCFTGYRPMRLPFGFDEDHPRCRALKEIIQEEIERKISRGCTAFYTAVARGADMICAETVLELRERRPAVRLVCAVTREEQAARWREEARERYLSIIERSDKIVIVSLWYTPVCCRGRSRWLVDETGHMIAVCGGKHGNETAMLAYAREKGREITLIDPVDLSVRHEGGNRGEVLDR